MNAKNIISEFEQEIVSTSKLMEKVPENQLKFKPHPRAMELGQLALHVALIPGRNLGFARDGSVEASVIVEHPIPSSKDEILSALNNSIQSVKNLLSNEDTSWLNNSWNLLNEGNSIAEMPTTSFIRTFVLNHWYHHRGQLSTYIRAIGEKVPSIYGPSTDENPFA